MALLADTFGVRRADTATGATHTHASTPNTLTIAEATGAKEHNPNRYTDRAKAPKPKGKLGDPPAYFDDIERDLWHEIAGLVPDGVLTSADRLLVEITARLLRRFRTKDPEIEPLKPVELGHLRACLGSMGLTPADRGRVTASDAPQGNDPLDIILGAKGKGKAN